VEHSHWSVDRGLSLGWASLVLVEGQIPYLPGPAVLMEMDVAYQSFEALLPP